VTRRVALGLAMIASTGCATVKMTRLEPDYEATDKLKVKRLAVVTSVAWHVPQQPTAEPEEKVRQLLSLMARRYVNQKRDFIVKKDVIGEPNAQAQGIDVFMPQKLCEEGLEGILWLDPELKREGNGVEAKVSAQLIRCGDAVAIWESQGAGSWPSTDTLLTQYTAEYVTKLGPEVEPYVAPSFHLLKAVLDTLPNPTLTDEDKDEKIALDE
jgi:probable lipoprotein (TIGR04455 family)